MMSDFEVQSKALEYIKEYGSDATRHAARWVAELRAGGAKESEKTWRRILAEIERLQALQPKELRRLKQPRISSFLADTIIVTCERCDRRSKFEKHLLIQIYGNITQKALLQIFAGDRCLVPGNQYRNDGCGARFDPVSNRVSGKQE